MRQTAIIYSLRCILLVTCVKLKKFLQYSPLIMCLVDIHAICVIMGIFVTLFSPHVGRSAQGQVSVENDYEIYLPDHPFHPTWSQFFPTEQMYIRVSFIIKARAEWRVPSKPVMSTASLCWRLKPLQAA